MTTELKEAGLDYIRATDDDKGSVGGMLNCANIIMQKDAEDGYKAQPGGQLGFYGRRSRHCFFGGRGEWAMLQVSGYSCREHQYQLCDEVRHVTRIDLQVTCYVGAKEVAKKIEEAEKGSLGAKPINGRKWDTAAIVKNGRHQTVYIGSRSSEWYGRVYDKYEESHKEEYIGCVRYEVEIKGDAAQQVWTQLRSKWRVSTMCRIVFEWMRQHGVLIEAELPIGDEIGKIVKEPKRPQRTVAWLFKQVAGSMSYLASEGYFYEALHAVFHKCLKDVDINTIMHYTSVVEGYL